MTTIDTTLASDGDPLCFDVVLRDRAGESRHRVSLARADFERLSDGRAPERLIEAAFRFLLDREPREAILARFDVSVISRYFDEFERELPAYLAQV
jgi:hypothetical protein